SNTIARYGESDEETFGTGDLFLITRPNLPYAGLAHSTRLRFTLLDPAILTRVAATAGDSATDPVVVLDHRPLSRQAAARLQRAIAHVRDDVMGDPTAPLAPLVVSTVSQYLAATVLHTFPNTAVTAPTVEDRHDAHVDTLRRAITFIDANPDHDIAVTDIARAAYVTPRAVQLAFRRHLATTPMAYLRRVRLECAHDDLDIATRGDGATVTDISYRWGFTSSSHFARQYRAAYGESPSTTLRN
ncbi:MAG: helix-turn-helix transcriptional regulator, partial [Trebonia sp.]